MPWLIDAPVRATYDRHKALSVASNMAIQNKYSRIITRILRSKGLLPATAADADPTRRVGTAMDIATIVAVSSVRIVATEAASLASSRNAMIIDRDDESNQALIEYEVDPDYDWDDDDDWARSINNQRILTIETYDKLREIGLDIHGNDFFLIDTVDKRSSYNLQRNISLKQIDDIWRLLFADTCQYSRTSSSK